MGEFYVFDAEQKANACINVLNSAAYFPIVGKRKVKPAPDKQQTIRWCDAPMLMLTGEWAVPRVPSYKLDKHNVPKGERDTFMGVFGGDIRTLTPADFPVEEV